MTALEVAGHLLHYGSLYENDVSFTAVKTMKITEYRGVSGFTVFLFELSQLVQ